MGFYLEKAKNYHRNRDAAKGRGAQCVKCAKTVQSPTVGVYANDAGNYVMAPEEAARDGFESLWAVGPECQRDAQFKGLLVDFYAPPVRRLAK